MGGFPWAMGLTPAQSRTVRLIRRRTESMSEFSDLGSYGWTIVRTPSTIHPPRYLEARHYIEHGPIARWVIEQDGSVSAWNRQGETRDQLVPYEAPAKV